MSDKLPSSREAQSRTQIGSFNPEAEGWVIRNDEPGLMDLVGPLWQRGRGHNLTFGFVAEEKHLNRRGVVHGGMLMAFADQALGLMARDATGDLPQATIHLDAQFIAPAVAGEFIEAKAEVVRRTRSVLFMRGTLFVGERVVASSQGIWKVLATG